MGALVRKAMAWAAALAGKWTTFGYHFEQSQGLVEADYFHGPRGEDQEPELTSERINAWIDQLSVEFVNPGLYLSAIKKVA